MILVGEGEVEAALQIWYWATVTVEAWGAVTCVWKKHCSEIPELPRTVEGEKEIFEKKMVFGKTMLDCLLTREVWTILEDWMALKGWGEDGAEAARRIRGLVYRNEMRRDWWERGLFALRPEWRNSYNRYEIDGIVAPFHDDGLRAKCTVPNP